MKSLVKLKEKARSLKREVLALYYASGNPKTGLLPKIIIVVTLGYALSPIDLIPDFIPVLGYLDDLIILPALIALAIRLIPKDIMAESRLRAEREPVRLKDNWFAAVLFMLLWIGFAALLAVRIFGLI